MDPLLGRLLSTVDSVKPRCLDSNIVPERPLREEPLMGSLPSRSFASSMFPDLTVTAFRTEYLDILTLSILFYLGTYLLWGQFEGR